MKIVVVVPTYNEAGSIEKLVRKLEEEFKNIPDHDLAILVVDDTSPDGTYRLVAELQKEFVNLHLLQQAKKEGLGAAYMAGMKYAMEKLAAEAVVEMDGDLQHNPQDLKRLVVQLDAGADYVLGSRFVKGGSIPRDWGFSRKFLSVFGNIFMRLVLGLPSITDYTTGFKASRVRGFLDQIDLASLAAKGFAYKIHLLYEMVKRGARVREIPIIFLNREDGVSKMEKNSPRDTFWLVMQLRFRHGTRRVRKYFTVGFLGLVINFSGLWFLVEVFNWHPALANLVSAELAVISNFYWNNRWTYADRKHQSLTRFFWKLFQFNLTSAIGVSIIQSGAIYSLTTFFGRRFYIFHWLLATSLLVVYNFTVYSKVIWRRSKIQT